MNWSKASSNLLFLVQGRKCLGLVRDLVETFLEGDFVTEDNSADEQVSSDDCVDFLWTAGVASAILDSQLSTDICLPMAVSFLLLLAGENDLCLCTGGVTFLLLMECATTPPPPPLYSGVSSIPPDIPIPIIGHSLLCNPPFSSQTTLSTIMACSQKMQRSVDS